MGILDIIKNLFNNNKLDARLITNDLTKTYGETEPLEIALYAQDKTPLTGKNIKIKINNVIYSRRTDDTGIAKLNINLKPGEYTALISFSDDDYNSATAYSTITIKDNTRMEGTDLTKTSSEKAVYQCAVYNSSNERIPADVDITVNGVTYTRTTDNEGLAKLNINLSTLGNYTITANFKGNTVYNSSNVTNTLTIKADPQTSTSNNTITSKLYNYITTQGGGKLGQKTGYNCAPHSLMQCIYRLTGIDLSESTLASVCGTTTSGTSHSGIETGLAWFNRKYGYNLKISWKNFSEVGFDGLQKAIDNGACFCHLLYRRSGSSGWGHYEVPQKVSGDNVIILNSLGSYCSYPSYCGYIETRSKSTQKYYIEGISQKSICIITKN